MYGKISVYSNHIFSRSFLASADDPASPEPSSKLKSAKIYLYIIFSLTIVQYSSKYVLNLVSWCPDVTTYYYCTGFIWNGQKTGTKSGTHTIRNNLY